MSRLTLALARRVKIEARVAMSLGIRWKLTSAISSQTEILDTPFISKLLSNDMAHIIQAIWLVTEEKRGVDASNSENLFACC